MKNISLKYYNNLDGLRGIAAFSVVIFHFFGSHGRELTKNLSNIQFYSAKTEILQHGVTLFFVLSGFVITRILLNTKSNSNYFGRFYKRRALRIFPLYYLYLIIHNYVYPWIVEGHPNLEFSRHFVQYFYLQNMTWLTGWQGSGPPHFWSLAVEEHFYLLWPLVLFILPRKMIKPATIFLLLLSIPIKLYFFENGIDINKNTFSRYDSIMIGCLIAIIERESNFNLKPINRVTALISIGITLALGSILYLVQDSIPVLKEIFKHIILAGFFGLVIYLLLTSASTAVYNRFLEHKSMQYFGRISYGLYVWHLLAMDLVVFFATSNPFLNLCLTFIVTIILSHISYYYFEKYFFRFK